MSNKSSLGTALITGGAKRIGGEISFYLAKIGYDIIIHYNNSKKEAIDLQKKIVADFAVKCDLIQANLADLDQVVKMSENIKRDFKEWNLLINNASIFDESDFLNGSIKDVDKNFNIHLHSPMILSKQLANYGQKANIINIVDKNIMRHDTKYFFYNLSKKSLADFTKMAACQLAPKIRVNAIAPGRIMMDSDDNKTMLSSAKIATQIPLQKVGNVQNIIPAIDYLLKNDYVTGEILFIDGGANLNHAG